MGGANAADRHDQRARTVSSRSLAHNPVTTQAHQSFDPNAQTNYDPASARASPARCLSTDTNRPRRVNRPAAYTAGNAIDAAIPDNPSTPANSISSKSSKRVPG